MTDEHPTRAEAQARADRIREFERELRQLEADGVLQLPEETRRRLRDHHAGLLDGLRRRFDIDTSDTERQMSWGMRIASTLGASALAVAVYFFFYRYWGSLSVPVQVLILAAAPCLALAGMEFARRRERTLYFTGLIGVVAFACFILDLNVLGAIFNVTPTQYAFVPWAAFALILAYAYGLRILLTGGIVSAMAFLTASAATWGGAHWLHFGMRPENLLLSGAVAFAVPFVVPHRARDGFPPVYRLLGMVVGLFAVFVLSNWGRGSYLRIDADAIEILYQLLGFLLSGLAIWFGIRRGHREMVHVGAGFFALFLYAKFFEWWWDWMPKYLFFLILGLIAVGLLLILNRARKSLRGVKP
jgi:hypothetical protein